VRELHGRQQQQQRAVRIAGGGHED
jgi:hypothetical protein